jgi:hypothetical protein
MKVTKNVSHSMLKPRHELSTSRIRIKRTASVPTCSAPMFPTEWISTKLGTEGIHRYRLGGGGLL